MSVIPARAGTWRNLPWCGEGRVADGDSITVLDADRVRHKIRLAGIDAPEKKQAFGNRPKEKLSELASDKTPSHMPRGLEAIRPRGTHDLLPR